MRHRRRIRKELLLSIFIAGLMVFSILGVMFGGYASQEQRVRYNNLVFIQTSQGWRTTVNNRQLYFRNLPSEVENIEITEGIIDRFDSIEVDVTYDFNSSLSQEIAFVVFDMQQKLSLRGTYVRDGFTTNTTYTKPIIRCGDFTDTIPVVLIRKFENSSVEFNECIVVNARTGDDLFALTDRIVYSVLGIIE